MSANGPDKSGCLRLAGPRPEAWRQRV